MPGRSAGDRGRLGCCHARGYSAGAEVLTSRRKKAGVRWTIEPINGGRDRHLRVFAYCV